MSSYLVRRLLLVIPTLLLASFIVFSMIRLIPGDVVNQMVMERATVGGYHHEGADEEMRVKIRHDLGLDVPIYVQYGRWLGDLVLRGDLGYSLWKETKVTDEIAARIPVTLELAFMALVASSLIAFPIAIFSAIRQDTVLDYMGRSLAIICIAVPSFWIGTMVMVFPPIWWGWSPPVDLIRFVDDPLGNLQMFIIPAVLLGMMLSGITMRWLRTMMLEVLRQDYIRTAWSKGLRERVVITRHALKNALIPVITLWGLQIRGLIGGTVIIEQIFCLPGLGRLTLEAIFKRDYTIVSGVMISLAVFILLLNVLVDLSYSWVDPRIRYK